MIRGDKTAWAIVSILLLLSISGSLLYRVLQRDGIVAVITKDGEVLKKINLEKVTSAREWTIEGKLKTFNTIRTEPGQIRFMDSNCPNRICVDSGWLKKPGDMAVCLPHRLVIIIEGKDKRSDIDVISR